MSNRQSGFTMIELIVVIVILGILAATALPKFIDLRTDAQVASVQGLAGALSSAASLNYAGCSAVNNQPGSSTNGVANSTKCVTVNSCGAVVNALQGQALPNSFYTTALTSGQTASSTNGTSFGCTLSYSDGKTTVQSAGYTAIAAGN